MQGQELMDLLVKACEILENNPEYLDIEDSGLYVPKENAPYEVKEYAKYQNKMNQRISSCYEGN